MQAKEDKDAMIVQHKSMYMCILYIHTYMYTNIYVYIYYTTYSELRTKIT
jgi:hypothetical protein